MSVTPEERAEQHRVWADRRAREFADAQALHALVVAEIEDVMSIGRPAEQRAMLSIAERHQPVNSYWIGCEHCRDGEDRADWPCPDFRDVAAAVEIEVPE